MKKVGLFYKRSLAMAFVVFFIASCSGEKGLEIPVYDMLHVSKYERDALKTIIEYDSRKIIKYSLYIDDVLASSTAVIYKPDGIYCTLNGIDYELRLDNTVGGSRVEHLYASINGEMYYDVLYRYDSEGRLSNTEINAQGGPYYTTYRYKESSIEIIDDGIYEIALGNEENTGYVFNVLNYANTSHTSKYVINPELYFLNIYGKPVGKLPTGYTVEHSGNTLRIGNHYYEYTTANLLR
ncbi:MAG: hypothetical protein LBG28_15075 [Tannerella sp.]|jgi:hypothetical protein|nr:hypothetical protein [Tannerella sp.]